ncbi:serine hydrolase [Streptomyces sp. NPDC058572]|uniref:serine hydrolase n=1 Tax=Streptomyces sp. NPDC058572 TaxID=3346546 RepID=UPI00365BE244
MTGAIVLAASLGAGAPTNATEKVRVTCTSPGKKMARHLAKDIAKALARRDSTASVALYDRKSRTACAYNEDQQQDAASIIKPIIMAALLFHNKGPLNGDDDALARKMITASDNSAATTLWMRLSDLKNPAAPDPVKIQEFLDRAGMKNTVLDREGFWGLSQVTAADQLQLLKLLTGNDDPEAPVLTKQARSYALGLMNQVQADQRWGAPAGTAKEAVVHVKNGWMQRSNNPDVDPYDRLDWKVNSMAAFTGDGYDYGLVVLSENNRVPDSHPAASGWVYGISTIEGVARVVHHDLRAVSKSRPGRQGREQAVKYRDRA